MKKSLFLLPLLAGLALCGCGDDNGGGGGGGESDDAVVLNFTMDFDYLYEKAGKVGYKGAADIDELEGASVTFEDCGPMKYYSDGETKEGSSIPAWDADPDDPALGIQFKASTGSITFENVKCDKITVVLLSSYDFAANDNIGVKFDGKSVKEKCSDTDGEETEWSQYAVKDNVTDFTKKYAITRYTVTFSVNAEEGADLQVYNCGAKGLRTVESITFE